MMSWSALKAHWIYWNIIEYWGTWWNGVCRDIMHRWKSHNTPRPRKHYFGDISVSPEGGIGTRATLATKMRKRLASPTNTRNVVEQRGISWCDVRVCFRSSLRVLEYHGISTNIVQYQSVGRSSHRLEYHGVSNNLVESYGMPWYHGLSVLEAHWPYWNIMEYRGAS